MDTNRINRYLVNIGQLPNRITDVTENISKGAESVSKAIEKINSFVDNLEQNNPISKFLLCTLNKGVSAINSTAHKFEDIANKVVDKGQIIAGSIHPARDIANKISSSLDGLKQCGEVLNASAVLVDAVIDTASGHFHPRANETAINQFSSKWDEWAKKVDEIFHGLSPDSKQNILETLAKEHFGDNIYSLGSAIKNESAGIFGGIADFEDSLKFFRGSYRNPVEAATKIEQGVNGIISATEKVANSLNNIILRYQRGTGVDETGNKILAYLGNLHDTTTVAALNKILSLGTQTTTLAADSTQLLNVIKSKDPLAIYGAGQQTINDIKAIGNTLKNKSGSILKKSEKSEYGDVSGEDNRTTPGRLRSGNQAQQASGLQRNDNIPAATSDSYVCSSAKMKCSFGDKLSTLTILPSRTIYLTGHPQANISDHQPLLNISPFGKCHTIAYPATGSATAANHGRLTPMPCVPNTPFPWMGGKNDVLLKGQPALLKSSKCKCIWGGTITFTSDGQSMGDKQQVPTFSKTEY